MKRNVLIVITLLLSIKSFSQGVVYDNKKPDIKYPYSEMIQLRNCNNERRTVTFDAPIQFFKMCVYGQYHLEKNKVLFFSKDYKMDSNYLRQGIADIKKSLPANFWGTPMGEIWYDNVPNKDSIWFIEMFVRVEKKGFIKVLSAYKITYVGNDARIDSQRSDPKISNIEFIMDKQKLKALEIKLKTAHQV